MLDIIFISYDEPNADRNWKALKERFPHAMRVHGVKGIANAHIAASKLANTTFFYVVDADAEISADFDFSYKPTEYEKDYVHIWHAYNPVIGMSYGYGGIKLFNKKMFKNIQSQLDFSTTLSGSGIKLMEQVACTTHFNSDALRTFRGSFREAVKLYTTSNNPNVDKNYRNEAHQRLLAWSNPLKCEYRRQVVLGVKAGIEEASKRSIDDLLFINDHDLILRLFTELHPEVDNSIDPTPNENCPMKHELFFTSRVAASLYDKYVLDNLPVTELRDAMSDGQMLSKLWLVEQLKTLIDERKITPSNGDKVKVAILGGWIGTLALMMNAWELPVAVTNVDLDERALRISEKLNYDFSFTTAHADMFNIDYSDYDVIINTSSEHIADIPAWRAQIPSGKMLIVQNNDYLDVEDHISNVFSSGELLQKLDLAKVHYEGTRKFPMYSRFMIIGTT